MNESNEPLFCLADVCNVLGLRQGDVRQRLDEGLVSTQPLETPGGIQQANFVNEDGLYDAILDSRKPEAKQFRKWVTSEVLPSIRKHGAYMVTTEEDTPETIMAKAILYADYQILYFGFQGNLLNIRLDNFIYFGNQQVSSSTNLWSCNNPDLTNDLISTFLGRQGNYLGSSLSGNK